MAILAKPNLVTLAKKGSSDEVDALIASEAFDLMVTCLQLRNLSISAFFALPNLSEFIVETILGSPSAKVRSGTMCSIDLL